jgi:hypothetical protein
MIKERGPMKKENTPLYSYMETKTLAWEKNTHVWKLISRINDSALPAQSTIKAVTDYNDSDA